MNVDEELVVSRPVGVKLEIPRTGKPHAAVGDVEWFRFEKWAFPMECTQVTPDLVVFEVIDESAP